MSRGQSLKTLTELMIQKVVNRAPSVQIVIQFLIRTMDLMSTAKIPAKPVTDMIVD